MSGLLHDLTGRRSPGLIAHSTAPPEPDPQAAPPAPAPVEDLGAPTRQDPQRGDRVLFADGTAGTVALTKATWIDPGEALVYRHEDQAHHGAPTWLVEAGSLVADHADPDGRHVFTYRGSLR